MAQYIITGRNSEGSTVVSAAVDSIDQDGPILDEMDIVNAVRAVVAQGAGVVFVQVQKYEQTITNV